jgi:1-acyl-sn-glycerol-3-phosphate acyltransferase
MADNQFTLLRSRRFLPLFTAQLLGAFVDNLFKSATLILLVFGGGATQVVGTQVGGTGGAQGDLLANLASGLFVLPFLLFSSLAGQVADGFDKARVIRTIKAAEVGIALLAVAALASGSGLALVLVLMLFGVQAAFLGPAKFAILPAHLRPDELVGGNAFVESGTFLAILLGTVLGGALAGLDAPVLPLAVVLLASTVAGFVASLRIPPSPSALPTPPRGLGDLNWNLLADTRDALRLAASQRTVLLAILGVSWFWLLGSAWVTQIPRYVQVHLHEGGDVATLLLACFAIGIGIGSLACERLSARRIEPGIVPIGSTGLSLFALDACFQTFDDTGGGGWLSFLLSADGSRLCADFILMGAFGGLFVVPLNAMMQLRAPERHRARILAVNNILNALFMVAAALFAALLLVVLDLGIDDVFLMLALMNLAVAWFIYHEVPEFTARFLIWLLTHTMYRVRHAGLEHVPERGAAMIACNHVSFVDALLLAGAVRRPIRFIMYKPIYDIPVLNFVFRAGGAIPIAGRKEDPAAFEQAFAQIRAALQDGDLLCIFPEGKLSRDGEIDVFRPGIERILAETPVPVVPMALRGLWGSWFSPEGGEAFAKRPRRFWSKVEIHAGPRLDPGTVTAEGLRAVVQRLRGDHR